ncbi:hypothetical protein [Propionivibrio sp.]|uniref:hypothetical protein n=1 Tax=Propionivibrio sp. TaxID=2212460 RepID=UPI00260AF80E|nr:hypothetical protein [Propionivibrio sp.]
MSGPTNKVRSCNQRINNMNDVLKAIDAAKVPDDVLASKVFDFDGRQLATLLDGAIYGRRFATNTYCYGWNACWPATQPR